MATSAERTVANGNGRAAVTHPQHGVAETVYEYLDEQGFDVVGVVYRFPDKQFAQGRLVGDEVRWGLNGGKLPLYRLPAICGHIAANRRDPVYLVEGEKDVHAAEAAGAIATTSPGGAGKFRPEHAEQLLGVRTLRVVVDRDPDDKRRADTGLTPGEQHAKTIVELLGAAGFAGHVELLQAADGKDTADHLAAGRTLDELVPFEFPTARVVGDPTVTLDEFVARKPDTDVAPLIASVRGPVVHAGALAFLAGKTTAGKTTWLVDLLLNAAAGVDYCGLTFPRPLRVLVIENEGPREGFRQKLEARLPHGPAPVEAIRVWDDPRRWGAVRVSDDDVRGQLRDAIAAHRTDLVVSDTLTRFGMKGNGTPEETRDFIDLLTDAGLGLAVAFLILLHTRTRTDAAEDEIEQVAGAWAPHADALLMLKRLDGNRARLSYPKTRWAHGAIPAAILSFDPDAETFTVVATEDPDSKVGPDTYDERVLEYVAEQPWCTTDELDNRVEGRATEVRAARKRLEQAGHLSSATSHELGRPGKGKRWNLSNQATQNPVPGLGTPQDETAPHPWKPANPVPPSRLKRGERGTDGVTAHPDEDELERLRQRHQDIAQPVETGGADRLARAKQPAAVDEAVDAGVFDAETDVPAATAAAVVAAARARLDELELNEGDRDSRPGEGAPPRASRARARDVAGELELPSTGPDAGARSSDRVGRSPRFGEAETWVRGRDWQFDLSPRDLLQELPARFGLESPSEVRELVKLAAELEEEAATHA